jgi:Lon protease-like protein
MTTLPLFPLGLVSFPEERLNLHIFEPRYKQLITECHENNSSFGIPPVIDTKPTKIGTVMRITEISHIYPDGKMDIKIKGERKFAIHKFYNKAPDKLYPQGDVEFIDDDGATDVILQTKVIGLIGQLYEVMKMNIDVPIVSNDFTIYSIAHKIGLNLEQEVDLLNIHSEIERLEFVEHHLTDFLPVVLEMENLRKRVEMNGHFQNVIPPDTDNLLNS